MAWLKIYQWEYQNYSSFFGVKISTVQADKLVRKFARHFKVWTPRIKITGRTIGRGYYSFGCIYLAEKGTTLMVVCHEFAHHLENVETGKITHRKSFKRRLRRVYTWAKRYLPKNKEQVLIPALEHGIIQV